MKRFRSRHLLAVFLIAALLFTVVATASGTSVVAVLALVWTGFTCLTIARRLIAHLTPIEQPRSLYRTLAPRPPPSFS